MAGKKEAPFKVARRKCPGLTQELLEARAGASQSLISSFERGHLPTSIAIAIRCARTMNTTVESLFGALVDLRAVSRPRNSVHASPREPKRTGRAPA